MPRKNKVLEFEGTLDEGDGMLLRLYGDGFEIKVALPFQAANDLFQDWFKHLSPTRINLVLLKHIKGMLGEEEED